MPVAALDNSSGHVATSEPHILLEGPAIVRHITLYSEAATGFVLRYVIPMGDLDELIIRRYDDEIPANDSWGFGSAGAVMVLPDGWRLELVLDADPAIPVEYSVDYGVAS